MGRKHYKEVGKLKLLTWSLTELCAVFGLPTILAVVSYAQLHQDQKSILHRLFMSLSNKRRLYHLIVDLTS